MGDDDSSVGATDTNEPGVGSTDAGGPGVGSTDTWSHGRESNGARGSKRRYVSVTEYMKTREELSELRMRLNELREQIRELTEKRDVEEVDRPQPPHSRHLAEPSTYLKAAISFGATQTLEDIVIRANLELMDRDIEDNVCEFLPGAEGKPRLYNARKLDEELVARCKHPRRRFMIFGRYHRSSSRSWVAGRWASSTPCCA